MFPDSLAVATSEKRRIRRFVAHFNSIQDFLKRLVPVSDRNGRWSEFAHLIDWYRKKHAGWSDDGNDLKAFAALRNVITHEEKEPDKHWFIPTAEAVARIQQIRKRLERPRTVIPEWKRTVVTVQLSDPVEKPLCISYDRDFSQLPVYDGPRFCGLLTENGITRWLSHAAVKRKTQVDLRGTLIGDMLFEDQSLPNLNYEFIGRDTHVSDQIQRFARNPGLEAALITSTGSQSEALLGIATRWDILEAMQRQ
jgi:predicted transcriptional regulator